MASSDKLQEMTVGQLRRRRGWMIAITVFFGLLLANAIRMAFSTTLGYVPIDAIIWAIVFVVGLRQASQMSGELRRRQDLARASSRDNPGS